MGAGISIGIVKLIYANNQILRINWLIILDKLFPFQ
jgi:hypothetical protein